ncbi:MAG: ATP-binding cassette domain-containing protein [Prevotellaceae bacterium]|nr:ATP-binding cassette domain-containing protein [Prevotellaceae bacterium]
MNTIALHHTLPLVFASRTDVGGDIWNTDVQLQKGHLYLVEASSGTGKSSLCSYVIGYRHDYRGTISFDGRDARSLKVADWVELRMRHISHLFQELRLFPELTAFENVQIKNKLTGFKSKKQIISWFEELEIADKANTRVQYMSFGQQQRVAMIRALVQPFDFILADEPVSHLDDRNADIMGKILMEEVRRQGAGVLITSIGKHIQLDYEKTFRL